MKKIIYGWLLVMTVFMLAVGVGGCGQQTEEGEEEETEWMQRRPEMPEEEE